MIPSAVYDIILISFGFKIDLSLAEVQGLV
jgi:hypothetical protein